MEVQKEKAVPHYKSRIRAYPEGPASEKKLHMEMKKEVAVIKEVALRRVQLGPRRPASCRWGVLRWLRL